MHAKTFLREKYGDVILVPINPQRHFGYLYKTRPDTRDPEQRKGLCWLDSEPARGNELSSIVNGITTQNKY